MPYSGRTSGRGEKRRKAYTLLSSFSFLLHNNDDVIFDHQFFEDGKLQAVLEGLGVR